jgi:hypothetical protein
MAFTTSSIFKRSGEPSDSWASPEGDEYVFDDAGEDVVCDGDDDGVVEFDEEIDEFYEEFFEDFVNQIPPSDYDSVTYYNATGPDTLSSMHAEIDEVSARIAKMPIASEPRQPPAAAAARAGSDKKQQLSAEVYEQIHSPEFQAALARFPPSVKNVFARPHAHTFVCIHCVKLKNVKRGADGRMTDFFCRSCALRISSQGGLFACSTCRAETIFVDTLGKTPYGLQCKDCSYQAKRSRRT